MATYVTLKSKSFEPILWHKVLHVLPEQGTSCEASVQIMSPNGKVSVVSIGDIDKIDKDGAPDAMAKLEKYRKNYLWVIQSCPYCGKKHTHGGGVVGENPRSYLGHRTSHCGRGNAGYNLKEIQ